MGRFPKSWGYPQSPSILDWDFPWNKPSSYWGGVAPWLWTPPYVVITHCLVGDDTTWLRILMKDHQTWELSLKKDSSYLRWGTWWILWDLCTLQAHHGICVLFLKQLGVHHYQRGIISFFWENMSGERWPFFSVYLLDDHWANNRAAQLNIDFFLQGTVSKVSHGM